MGIERKDGTSIIIESQPKKSNDTLIIIIGGFSYTINHPILYYSKSIAKELKCDYVGIDYDYAKNSSFLKKPESDQDAYFEEDNVLVKDYIDKVSKTYKNIIFVGKSMGTSIISRLFTDEEIMKKSSFILITPGTEWDRILKKIITIDNAILVIGSMADSNYKIDGLEELYKRQNIKVLEIEGANHILEIGKVDQDIDILKTVTKTIEEFIIRGIRLTPASTL